MSNLLLWRGWAVWAIAALCAVVLWWRQDPGRTAVPAIVIATHHRLGPLEASRIRAVYVKPGDPVHAGDAIVELDCSEIDAELSVARAQLEENLAEVEAVALGVTSEARRRRMAIETELARSRAALATAKGLQEARQAELTVLTDQLEQLDEAIRTRLAQVDRLTALRTRQERLSRQTHYIPEALLAWTELGDQVRDALESLDSEDLSVPLRPLEARVTTQTQRIQQLLERRTRCTLRTPVDGYLSQVFHASGDAVPAGETVAVVVSPEAIFVTAYVPEANARTLRPGGIVEVFPRDRAAASGTRGVVERVGPEIVEMPARLWLAPARPRYGRPVHIRLDAGADLIPGELAYAQARRGAVQAASLPTEGELVEAHVPETLKSRTRLEPSGLTWLSERNRFLVVSDDTGLPGANEHRPWIFTVDVQGRFDPHPLPVYGIDAISDLESVARAPDGSIYLLASQSLSRKGRRPLKRQWLLRAESTGDGLAVTGRLPLYDQLLARLDPSERAELGVSEQLDIEGMAWYQGGLLLGLKAPLDGADRARLWYLADVDTVLTSGDALVDDLDDQAAAAHLSLFGTLALPTCAAGVPGGVSGLHVEGERLYILSTVADGAPCGSAWTVDLPLRQTSPRKLTDWAGVRPEGIARAGDGELLVSFDTGTATPRFAQLADG